MKLKLLEPVHAMFPVTLVLIFLKCWQLNARTVQLAAFLVYPFTHGYKTQKKSFIGNSRVLEMMLVESYYKSLPGILFDVIAYKMTVTTAGLFPRAMKAMRLTWYEQSSAFCWGLLTILANKGQIQVYLVQRKCAHDRIIMEHDIAGLSDFYIIFCCEEK